ncbi:MAG: hypothetical protein AMXMBFR34_03460 [Myxococcaceae bacterium]
MTRITSKAATVRSGGGKSAGSGAPSPSSKPEARKPAGWAPKTPTSRNGGGKASTSTPKQPARTPKPASAPRLSQAEADARVASLMQGGDGTPIPPELADAFKRYVKKQDAIVNGGSTSRRGGGKSSGPTTPKKPSVRPVAVPTVRSGGSKAAGGRK